MAGYPGQAILRKKMNSKAHHEDERHLSEAQTTKDFEAVCELLPPRRGNGFEGTDDLYLKMKPVYILMPC